MSAFAAFVMYLIDKPYQNSKSRRKAFFLDPLNEMKGFATIDGTKLSDEEMSVIMSLDYRLISEYADDERLDRRIRDFVGYNDGDHDWPEPGNSKWDPWENGRKCKPDALALADQRIFWSGPQSKIVWVFRDSAARGETFDLRLAGEGLLPEALVTLKQIAEPYREIVAIANDYISCNIRRSYLSATITVPGDVAPGLYNLSVSNKNWSRHRLEWGLPFSIA
jgi:hypothetical protein